MRKKLAILVMMLGLLILAASPAFADVTFTQVDGVASFGANEFLGFDTAAGQVDGVTAEAQSDFFGGSVFNGPLF